MRFLANLAATLVLVLLLAAPSVFSNNLVEFKAANLSFAIYNDSGKFGQFLKLEEVEGDGVANFNLEFTTFAQEFGLYKQILVIENIKEFQQKVRIVNQSPVVEIFFDTGGQNYGPTEVTLLSGQKIGINLLVPAANLTKTASFSLE